MRVFVAIDLPDRVRDEVEVLQHALSVGRLLPPENFHLTLSFLGDQSDEALEDAHEALSSMRLPAFDLQLAGVGAFGKRSPNLIFADVLHCDPLRDLEQRINRKLRNAGLDFQKQRFRPHVTIARLPKVLSAFELASVHDYIADNVAFRSSCFRVGSFEMYQSTLMTSGARHEVLARYELLGNGHRHSDLST